MKTFASLLTALALAASIPVTMTACTDDGACAGDSCVCTADSDCARTCGSGADCNVACNGAPRCDVTCTAAASCDVNCATSGNCAVACPDSGCSVACPETGCVVDNCPDPSTCTVTCGQGAVATYDGTRATCP